MKRILLFLIAALMYSMNAFTQTTFIDDTQVSSSKSFSISCYMGFENYYDAYMPHFMDAVGHFNTDVLHSVEYPIWCSGYPETLPVSNPCTKQDPHQEQYPYLSTARQPFPSKSDEAHRAP